MDGNITDLDARLARLEGQYHALSQELNDNFKEVRNTLQKVQKQVDELGTVKGGMFRSQSLGDVMKRLDQQVGEMHQQVQAISDALQVRR
jgi:ABC-type transporter Mla subunit MlaD